MRGGAVCGCRDILSPMNRFLEWIGIKQKMHANEHKPPLVSVRDIWWAALGENVGSEINGKSERFTRPVLVMKKLAHGFYLVAPTTTKLREGTWYVHIRLADKDEYICLHQIRTIDYRRLYSKIGQIDTDDFARVKEAFWRLYK